MVKEKIYFLFCSGLEKAPALRVENEHIRLASNCDSARRVTEETILKAMMAEKPSNLTSLKGMSISVSENQFLKEFVAGESETLEIEDI